MTVYDDNKYGERLAVVESLLKHILDGQLKLERQINQRFDKFEMRYEKRLEEITKDCQDLDDQISEHQMEDAKIYKKLRYKVIEYIVIAILASIIASIISNL